MSTICRVSASTSSRTRQIVDTYRYAPFGAMLAGGVSDNSLKFTAQWQDAATGLYYLRARYYDPTTGRFLTRDPFPGLAALPQTRHPYVYVSNNPVNLTDPAGEIPPIIVAAGTGAAIGAVDGVGDAFFLVKGLSLLFVSLRE